MFRLRITKVAERLFFLGGGGLTCQMSSSAWIDMLGIKKGKLHWLSHYKEFAEWLLTLERRRVKQGSIVGSACSIIIKKKLSYRWEPFCSWHFLGLKKFEFVVIESCLLLRFIAICWQWKPKSPKTLQHFCRNAALNLFFLFYSRSNYAGCIIQMSTCISITSPPIFIQINFHPPAHLLGINFH